MHPRKQLERLKRSDQMHLNLICSSSFLKLSSFFFVCVHMCKCKASKHCFKGNRNKNIFILVFDLVIKKALEMFCVKLLNITLPKINFLTSRRTCTSF